MQTHNSRILELTLGKSKSALENKNPMTAQLDTPKRNYRASFGLIAFVSLCVLSGCGVGWQPDRDVRQDQTQLGIEGRVG